MSTETLMKCNIRFFHLSEGLLRAFLLYNPTFMLCTAEHNWSYYCLPHTNSIFPAYLTSFGSSCSQIAIYIAHYALLLHL